MDSPEFKICPFCHERIKIEATKCRYCGEWLESHESAPSATASKDAKQAEPIFISVSPITPESQSTVINPIESGRSASRMMSRLSFALLIFSVMAMILSLWDVNLPNVPQATEKIAEVLIRILAGAGGVGWILHSITEKRRGVGFLAFSVVCAIGVGRFAYSIHSELQDSKRAKQNDRAFWRNSAAVTDKMLAFVEQGGNGTAPAIEMTGNPRDDEISRAINYLIVDVIQNVTGINKEIDSLDLRSVFEDALLSSRADIKKEEGKRIACLQIIEKFRQQMFGTLERCKAKSAFLNLSEEDKRSVNLGMENGFQRKAPQMQQFFSLLRKQHQAQLDFLELMDANFGGYELNGKTIRFATAENSERYNLLSKRVEDAEHDFADFTQRQLDAMRAGKEKLLEMGK